MKIIRNLGGGAAPPAKEGSSYWRGIAMDGGDDGFFPEQEGSLWAGP